MPTAYPGGVDNFANPASTDNLNTAGVTHAASHTNLNDAVEAIEAFAAIRPASADAIRFVSKAGSDAKDGLSMGSAKLTIQAAIDSLPAGGGVVKALLGTWEERVTWPTKCHVIGAGPGVTELKLPNNTAGDVVKSAGFDALVGGDSTGGIYQSRLADLSIDGNKANNATGGRGIAIYGYDYVLDNVPVRNCKGDGIFSRWSSSAPAISPDAMEAYLNNVTVHDCDNNGITWKGPHDSKWFGVVAYQNGAKGFEITPNGGALMVVACHSWGNSQTYAWDISASVMAVNCQAEGASVAQVRIATNDVQWQGGQVFAAGGAPVGFEFGIAAGAAPVDCRIDTLVLNCTTGAIRFANDGGGNVVNLTAYQTSGTVVAGTRNPGTALVVRRVGAAGQSAFFVPDGGMTVGGGLTVTGGDVTVDADRSLKIGTDIAFYRNGADQVRTDDEFVFGGNLSHFGSGLGFFSTSGWSKQTVTGSRGGNAALASLLTALANYGLITNNTTA